MLEALLADLTSGDEARAEASVPQLAALGETIIPSMQALLHGGRARLQELPQGLVERGNADDHLGEVFRCQFL